MSDFPLITPRIGVSHHDGSLGLFLPINSSEGTEAETSADSGASY